MGIRWAIPSLRRRPVDLIFRWRRPHGLSFRLVFFLVLSTAMHLAAFYVFEVVYPPNRKVLPRDAGGWVLPAGDARVQALIEAHSGPADRMMSEQREEARLLAAGVPMRLSFDGYAPRFLPLPVGTDVAGSAYPDAVPLMLPEVDEALPPDAPLAVAARHQAVLTWENGEAGDGIPVPWSGAEEEGGRIGIAQQLEYLVAFDARREVREVVVLRGGGPTDVLWRRGIFAQRVPDSLPTPAAGSWSWVPVRIFIPARE